MTGPHPVYIATVLLEPNRWTPGKVPTFRVSEWGERLRDAGFDGVELWENHAALADEGEVDALAAMACPVRIFNSYCSFDDEGAQARARAAGFVRRFGADGVKFNLGHDAAAIPTYLRNLDAWRRELPDACRLLCECHAGTVLEDPSRARDILAPVGGIEIIVHAFAGEEETLRRWLGEFGPAVTHVHATIRDSGPERVRILQAAGFAGTFSIEFTEGVAREPEDMAALFAGATADMRALKEALAR